MLISDKLTSAPVFIPVFIPTAIEVATGLMSAQSKKTEFEREMTLLQKFTKSLGNENVKGNPGVWTRKLFT